LLQPAAFKSKSMLQNMMRSQSYLLTVSLASSNQTQCHAAELADPSALKV
jgi:hypothetical protein